MYGDFMDTKIKDYLDRTEFHLRDFAKTKGLHESYKEDIFNKLMEDKETQIEEHFSNLKDNVVYKVRERQRMWKLDLTKISNISMIKTDINHFTRSENLGLIDWITYDMQININETTKSKFAIKFYLRYYKKINEIMKEALIELVTDGL